MTPPEPDSDDVPDEEWLVESLLKKLDRDDQCELPDQPRPLLQLVVAAAGPAAPGTVVPGTVVPGGEGSQLRRGISA